MADKHVPTKCPCCGKPYTTYPALSRRDNETYICPNCGTAEALQDYFGREYTGKVYWNKKVKT